MAEALNYRMNLVIDPKNVIKANRELRAMERYFERIQGRVMKIGRTRMVPEIVLKDSASRGLDILLQKMGRVKNQLIQASTTVDLKVQQNAITPDYTPLVDAMKANTDAVLNMTSALAQMKLGEPQEKTGGVWDKVKDGFGAAKSIGGGVKSAAEIPEKFQSVIDALQGKEEDKKCCCCDGGGMIGSPLVSRGGRRNGRNAGRNQKNPATPKGGKWSKTRKTIGALGSLVETVGSAGGDLIGGFQGFGNLFGGKKKTNGIAASTTTIADSSKVPDAPASSSASKSADTPRVAKAMGNAKPGFLARTVKGLGKRLMGPLGFMADAAAIASAEPGKERAKAIGSTVGGGIGAAIGGLVGSVIPGAGTFIGSTLGGAAGSWIGEKAGSVISDASEKIKDGFSKVSSWFSSKILGKKDTEEPPKKEPEKPAVTTSPAITSAANPAVSLSGAAYPYTYSQGFADPAFPYSTASYPGPHVQSALYGTSGVSGGTNLQTVQITPEQMASLTGLLTTMKSENTTNYNLPSGAVQVTVHEVHPVDVEGLILQIGQRLRSEFNKAAYNRKPGIMAY